MCVLCSCSNLVSGGPYAQLMLYMVGSFHPIIYLSYIIQLHMFVLSWSCIKVELITHKNVYVSQTTHVTNTKLGQSTPILDPAITLESRDCKPSVTKLVNALHTYMYTVGTNATVMLTMNLGMTLRVYDCHMIL